MRENDTSAFQPRDIAVAIGLLTRLPVKLPQSAYQRGAQAAWAFPVVGLVLAGAVSACAGLALWLGFAPEAAAVIALGLSVMMTGGLHEDGLADSADGLWGGWDRDRRLEIMKDSHIGSYGVIALVLTLGAQWWALSALLEARGAFWPLLAAATLSRAAMPVLMSALDHARSTGLSHAQGRPSWGVTVIGCLIAAGIAVIGAGGTGVTLICVAAGITAAMAMLAHRKIGGQTGDILGATQKITEVALLLVLAS